MTSTDSFYIPPGAKIGLGQRSSNQNRLVLKKNSQENLVKEQEASPIVNTDVTIDSLLREMSSIEEVDDEAAGLDMSKRLSTETVPAEEEGIVAKTTNVQEGELLQSPANNGSGNGTNHQEPLPTEEELIKYLLDENNFKKP